MLSDTTSEQQDSRRCEHCGAPLASRFSPCPSCRMRPVDTFGVRPTPAPGLQVPLNPPQSMLPSTLPTRRIWSPSRALVKYDVIEEPVAVKSVYQRLRRPVALGASVLVATSAVYLGFIHSNELRVGEPIAVSGKVQTQNGKASVAAAQKPGAAVRQRPSSVVALQPPNTATRRSSVVAQQAPSAATQRPGVGAQQPPNTVTQRPNVIAQQSPSAATQRPSVVAQQPPNTATQRPSVVAQQAPNTATQRPSVVAQQAPNTATQRPSVVAQQSQNTATQRPSVVAQQSQNTTTQRPSVIAQQPPNTATQRSGIVTQQPAPARSSPATSLAAAPPPQRRVASTTPDTRRSTGNQPTSPADKLRADVSRHLRAARANLQRNNLSATKTRLAAAIAVQPDNRDAQRMRSALNTREQERDALLSLARGCGYIGRWGCVSRNAGTALQIDASSTEAQRLVTLATRESELQIAAPPVEPAPEPLPEQRDWITHH